MSDWRQSTPRPPSDPSPARRPSVSGERDARIAAQVHRLDDHLRRVGRECGSPIEPPRRLRVEDVLEFLDEIGVEPTRFFAELVRLWQADARRSERREGEGP